MLQTITESETRAYIAVIDMPEIVKKATFDRKYDGNCQIPGSYQRY